MLFSLFMQVFADLAEVKLDKTNLNAAIDRNEQPDSRGSFGIVVKRLLNEVSVTFRTVMSMHARFYTVVFVHSVLKAYFGSVLSTSSG